MVGLVCFYSVYSFLSALWIYAFIDKSVSHLPPHSLVFVFLFIIKISSCGFSSIEAPATGDDFSGMTAMVTTTIPRTLNRFLVQQCFNLKGSLNRAAFVSVVDQGGRAPLCLQVRFAGCAGGLPRSTSSRVAWSWTWFG